MAQLTPAFPQDQPAEVLEVKGVGAGGGLHRLAAAPAANPAPSQEPPHLPHTQRHHLAPLLSAASCPEGDPMATAGNPA